jgi:hypothetical protein
MPVARQFCSLPELDHETVNGLPGLVADFPGVDVDNPTITQGDDGIVVIENNADTVHHNQKGCQVVLRGFQRARHHADITNPQAAIVDTA